ncbi:L-aminoadipate-semialdehyde dehydrogenase-phosphopantetheinyl transferase [Amia ocellicauda]|uniref:L-aminoadipate-semialdehyde dehydrogenase-phosphopantetheinyl transferase n=1 Tax=Amia ocellicauda TaxID=2972642 RepID=UPI00346425AD|nr:ADPPT transferase [Amia calva]
MEGVRWAFRCGCWGPARCEWLLAARCVQREERDRIGRFVFAKDAKSAMVGRLLIRKLIAEKMGIVWDEILLQRTAKGKPFLASPAPASSTNYNFNISHQGDYAVLAAESGLQVGVDVMKTTQPGSSTIADFFRIMTRQFTDHEWRVIKTAGPEWTQLDMFYRHWALKESFIKAIGTGVGFNLQRVEFHVSPLDMSVGRVYKDTRMYLDGEEEDGWVFEECMLDADHHVAVALGKPDKMNDDCSLAFYNPIAPEFTMLSFSDLVSGAVPLTEEDLSYWENFQSKPDAPRRQSATS